MSGEPKTAGKLDADRLFELRLRARLSQRGLASATGVSAGVIKRLENHGSDRQLTLNRLRVIAEQLGVSVVDLLTTTPSQAVEAAADDTKLEAALLIGRRPLLTEELATGLAWDLLRTRRALRALETRLTAGATLKRTQAGWQIKPRESVLTAIERGRLEQTTIRRRGLSVRQLRLLDRLIAGDVTGAWEQRASNADRVDLAVLLRSGIATRTNRGSITLTPEAEYSLQLTPIPAKNPIAA